ncbi:hypothetical protein OUZ56_020123 [Daphnia magna]|uniref:Uncharacterized protein n=1 Tax=Daphnia magna TaxID=35525 RepID=A0ABQ9ZEB8_9CRUS|nr:hypothetical protein OUZ56_020123 [Daphnia magna]
MGKIILEDMMKIALDLQSANISLGYKAIFSFPVSDKWCNDSAYCPTGSIIKIQQDHLAAAHVYDDRTE